MLPERVIRIDGQGLAHLERDPWTFVGLVDGAPHPLPGGPIVVPLDTWRSQRVSLLQRGAIGVWLGPADDPAELATDLDALPLVGVHFPKFTDGRGYSTAALLRHRHHFEGELRAFGDVGRDQLYYLRRCGFDAFSLAPHRDPEAALGSLHAFSVRYQASIDDPRPLFRRRAAQAR